MAGYHAGVGTMRLGPRFSWGDDEVLLSEQEHRKLPSWIVVEPRRRDFIVVPRRECAYSLRKERHL